MYGPQSIDETIQMYAHPPEGGLAIIPIAAMALGYAVWKILQHDPALLTVADTGFLVAGEGGRKDRLVIVSDPPAEWYKQVSIRRQLVNATGEAIDSIITQNYASFMSQNAIHVLLVAGGD